MLVTLSVAKGLIGLVAREERVPSLSYLEPEPRATSKSKIPRPCPRDTRNGGGICLERMVRQAHHERVWQTNGYGGAEI